MKRTLQITSYLFCTLFLSAIFSFSPAHAQSWQVDTWVGTAADNPALDTVFTITSFETALQNPESIAVDTNHNVYIIDQNRLIRVNSLGSVTLVAGTTDSGDIDGKGSGTRLNNPHGLAFDSNERYLYIADSGNKKIKRFDPITQILSTVVVFQSFEPYDIAIDRDNNLYLVGNQSKIYKFSPYDSSLSTYAGNDTPCTDTNPSNCDGTRPTARFTTQLRGITIDKTTNTLYVTDGNFLRMISNTDVFSQVGTGTDTNIPSGISIDSSGNIFIADTINARIKEIINNANGDIINFTGNGAGYTDGAISTARFNLPKDIFVAPSGEMFIADSGNQRIRRIFNPTTTTPLPTPTYSYYSSPTITTTPTYNPETTFWNAFTSSCTASSPNCYPIYSFKYPQNWNLSEGTSDITTSMRNFTSYTVTVNNGSADYLTVFRPETIFTINDLLNNFTYTGYQYSQTGTKFLNGKEYKVFQITASSNEISTLYVHQLTDGSVFIFSYDYGQTISENTFELILSTFTLLNGYYPSPTPLYEYPGYSAQWVSQTTGTGGGNNPILIKRGETTNIQAQFRNDGTATWFRDTNRNDFVAFYVYKDLIYSTPPEFNNPTNPNYGRSYFANSLWGRSFDKNTEFSRAATLREEFVLPGNIGTFDFTFTAPINAFTTLHREDLSLAYGPNWMPNYYNGDPALVAHVWFPIKIIN
ncbi:MAG: hypothetical protein WCP97_05395 [bacterium]